MQRTPFVSGTGASMPRGGPVTRALVALLVVASATLPALDRGGLAHVRSIVFDRGAILSGEVWRLLSYGFFKSGGPISLLLAALALYFLAAGYEARFGGAALARFCALSLVGAAALALPLGAALDRLGVFVERDGFGGPDAAIDALLVALTLQAPNSEVLFGFVLPMRARQFLLLLLGLELLGGLMTGASSLGITVGGMAMGYLQQARLWDVRLLRQRVQWWRLRRQRRHALYVVPPPRAPNKRRRFDGRPN